MGPFPEAARGRDLRRYFQPWLDAQNIVRAADGRAKGLTYEGYQPQNCRDTALTAFAQLATLRLDVRRAMVSLIDSSRQYILAEATKTLSLYSNTPDRPEDEVWLGNTIIARDDAVCPYTFTSTYTAKEENGEVYTTNCLIISDLRDDPRFADKDYVKGEPGIRFYAGVPIVTKAGYRIGVYAVSDDKPRDGLSANDVRFMQDIAATVMEHLELAKDADDRNKGERMVRGLTDFIERSSMQEARNRSGNRPTTIEKQTENARMDSVIEDILGDTVPPAALTSTVRQGHRKREAENKTDTIRIFQRAARIIRQSTFADGVVFFDTSAAGIGGHAYENSSPIASSDESLHSSTTDLLTTDSTATSKRKHRDKQVDPSGEPQPSGIENDGGIDGTVPTIESKPCPVAGLSLRAGNPSLSERDFSFTESDMERYIRRYPYGKFFSFDEDGTGVNSSDERSEKSGNDSDNRAAMGTATRKPTRKRRERFIPSELLNILPDMRSLIFLPLWDPASERWIAGGFIWTNTAGRLMSPENEFPYLKAFGNSITSEVARSHAQKSDRAKTTFIASISHELRSPLHGILGSVEFLQLAVTSAYQKSLVSSIETCGKTLLDTIDHVLDYAKINKLQNANSRRKNRSGSRNRRSPGDNSILGVTTDFNLAQLVEEVCDTVCTGHNFRQAHTFHSGAFHDQGSHSRASSTGAGSVEDVDHTTTTEDQQRVAVTLHTIPFVNWIVRSQPGAMRRIVMNMLGNALKYTDAGYISVTLSQESSTPQWIVFKLSVEDSGRGMSTEYQRTKLFAPFSQEDPFSNGTGLGLSIVKQIVDSLKGEIEVKSTLNAGTKITVSLRLPAGTNDNARTSRRLLKVPEALKRKSVNIVFPSDSPGNHKTEQSIRHACHGFNMTIIDDFDLSVTQPDFLLIEPASLEKILVEQQAPPSGTRTASPPLVVVCICTDTAEKAAFESRASRWISALGWAVEAVVQPCGPRKLARLLLDTQNRIARGEAAAAASNPIPSPMISFGPPPLPELPHPRLHGPPTERQKRPRSGSSRGSSRDGGSSSTSLSKSPVVRVTPVFGSSGGGGGGGSLDPPPPPPPRVLLVDDNAINLKLLVVFARRQGLSYSEAMNGLEAFEKFKSRATAILEASASASASASAPTPGLGLTSASALALNPLLPPPPPPLLRTVTAPAATGTRTRPFDVVLIDISMPVMDGLEATRRIRQLEAERGLPRSTIVALTGLASAQDQRDAVDAGVDMYLVKPVKFADIERLFQGRGDER